MNNPSSLMDNPIPRSFTVDEQEQKRIFYERMSPRRRKFIDRIGFENWDPFEPPKEPMDMKVDVTQHTISQLVNTFLASAQAETRYGEYARGAMECAYGLVNKDDKYRGVFDFCLWYHDFLQKEVK